MTKSTHRKNERQTRVAPLRQDAVAERTSLERTLQPISRRRLLGHALTLGALVAWPAAGSAQSPKKDKDQPSQRSKALSLQHLTGSKFAYVSPLRSNGQESTCHGEVWYAWLDESIVVITAKTTWKARALAAGLDSARIWVGNYGRWKGWLRNSEAFMQAPNFLAHAKTDHDPALLERLMNVYKTKYPAEFPAWEDRQRSGFRSGERIIIRYSRA